jgi:hypothetical protein
MAGDAPPVQPQMLAEALANMAKGTGAGLAGMPVDLMTTAMRPFGYDVEQPVGGSDWFGGLMDADTDSGAFMAGQFASPDPMDAARVANYGPELQNLIEAMTVFHGSPHKWDKVDLSKVGTGEGVQAYGHGLYVAENDSVAKQYQALGRPKDASIKKDGEKFKATYKDRQGREYDLGAFDSKEAADDAITKANGNLYELDLPDETIDKMLDWDKPLSEQTESVRGAFESTFREWAGAMSDNGALMQLEQQLSEGASAPSIGTLYGQLSTTLGGQKAASQALRDAGIPGIRYLDGTSRDTGKGTRNFVVFDESYIKPLTRNGQPIKE